MNAEDHPYRKATSIDDLAERLEKLEKRMESIERWAQSVYEWAKSVRKEIRMISIQRAFFPW